MFRGRRKISLLGISIVAAILFSSGILINTNDASADSHTITKEIRFTLTGLSTDFNAWDAAGTDGVLNATKLLAVSTNDVPDGDGSYITSTSNNDIQGFTSNVEITDIVESINHINVTSIAHKVDEARKATKFSQGVALGGVPIALPNGGAELQSGYTIFTQTFEKNPFTGKNLKSQDPWLESDLANLEYIVEQNTDTKEVRVTQVYVDVSYETAPPSIEITSPPTSAKWGHPETVEGTASGFGTVGTITVDWGDGTVDPPFAAISPWSAAHEYASSASTTTPTVIATLTVGSEAPTASVGITVTDHTTSLDAPTLASSELDPLEVKWGHTFQVTANILTDEDAGGCTGDVVCDVSIAGKTITYSGTAVASAGDGTSPVGTAVNIVSVGSGNTGDQTVIADFDGTSDNPYTSSTSASSTIAIIAHDTSLLAPTLSIGDVLWGNTFTVGNTLTDDDALPVPAAVLGETITYSGTAVASPTDGTSTVTGLNIIASQNTGSLKTVIADFAGDADYNSSTSSSSTKTILKHHTSIEEFAVMSSATEKPIEVAGILVDTSVGNTGISFMDIIITDSGSNGIPNTITGGVVVQDSNINDETENLEVAICSAAVPGDCDIQGTTINELVLLEAGDKLVFERSIVYVTLHIVNSADKVVNAHSNDANSVPYQLTDEAGSTMLFGPNVNEITIDSVSGGDGLSTIGLFRIVGTNAEANIQTLDEGVSTVNVGTYEEIPIGGGAFGTGGIAQSESVEELEMTAAFNEDDLYLGSSANDFYALEDNLQDDTDLGFGALVNVVADSGVGIVGAICGIDSDKDAACHKWETDGKAVKVDGEKYRYHFPEMNSTTVDTPNVILEIDYMTDHEPSATALQWIKDVFLENGIIVTFIVDEELTHVPILNVWTDNDSNPDNDYNSIKSKHYGIAAERSSVSGQSTVPSTISPKSHSIVLSGTLVTTPPHPAAITDVPGGVTDDLTAGTITIKTLVTTDNLVILSVPAILTPPPSPGTGLTINGDVTASVLPIPGTEHIITVKVPFLTSDPLNISGAITDISLGSITVPVSTNIDAVNFDAVTNTNSPTVLSTLTESYSQVVRYVIYGHSMGGASGTAEFLGNDIAITLGEGFGGSVVGHTGSVGTNKEQAGTLMHELGHWLGLKHGGPEVISGVFNSESDVNCKPNYISVMSYTRQTKAYLGSADWRLDFSHGNMSPLTENALDEELGFITSAEQNVRNPYIRGDGKVIKPWSSSTFPTPDEIPIATNFNGDGTKPSPGTVSVDINNFGIPGCSVSMISTDPYNDFNDWNNLEYNFRDTVSGQYDGSTAIYPSTISDLNFSFLQLAELQSFDVALPIAIPPPNPDGTTSANGGSNLPIKVPIYLFETTDPIDYAVLHAEYLIKDSDGAVTGPFEVLDKDGNRLFEYDVNAEFYSLGWLVPSPVLDSEVWVTVFVADKDPADGALFDVAAIPETCVGFEEPTQEAECATFKIIIPGSGDTDFCIAHPNHKKCQ